MVQDRPRKNQNPLGLQECAYLQLAMPMFRLYAGSWQADTGRCEAAQGGCAGVWCQWRHSSGIGTTGHQLLAMHMPITPPAWHCAIGAWADEKKRRPRTAAKSLRKRHEGPWVWLAYREVCYLFSTHRFAPHFLTFVRRVHSETFEGGLDAPHFFASEWVICIRIDRVISARDAGA